MELVVPAVRLRVRDHAWLRDRRLNLRIVVNDLRWSEP
jgi:hypothetical protein